MNMNDFTQDLEMKFARLMVQNSIDGRRKLWRKLSKLLSNGVPILNALKSIYDRKMAAGQAKDPFTIAIGDWLDALNKGQRLAQCVVGWVPRDEQMLIAAGEQSGQLDAALENACEIMIAKNKIKKAVIGGMAYPVIMFFIALGVLIMFSYKVIPEFARVVPYERWRGVAKILIDLADFTKSWLPLILVVIFAVVVAFFVSLSRWSDGLRVKFDRYIPYSIYRMLQGGTWMISLAALVNAGVRMETAIEDLKKGANNWMETRLNACLRGMRQGLTLGDALVKSGYEFPDREIIDDLGVYSKLSGIEDALTVVGKEWVDDGVERIQGLMKAVFGISVLVVGLFIAFMVGGLIGMEMQMTELIKGQY